MGPVMAWHKKWANWTGLDCLCPQVMGPLINVLLSLFPLFLSLLSGTGSFWSSNMVYCGYWYWIPLFLFSDSLLITAKKIPAVTMPVLIPNHQQDTLIPSPCLKGSYSLAALEELTSEENKTEKDPLWTLSHQAINRSYCWFYFHGIDNIASWSVKMAVVTYITLPFIS